MRSGRRKVREWLAALCSVSGATTQTSFERLRAIASSTLMPGAWMPSSFVTRMRALARSSGASNIRLDRLDPAHIGPQRLRHLDGAVLALIVLHHRDQRATDRDAGAVERMHERAALLAGAAEARVHAPGLEIAAIGAARNLAIGVLTRQPDLDVIGLARGKAHVARAEKHDAVRQVQPLQDRLGAGGHALVLVLGFIGVRDRHQLDLIELMLAQHAARVLASGAS